MTYPLHFKTNFVVFHVGLGADSIPVTDDFYEVLDQKYGDFAGRSLISYHTFSGDWPSWEAHPKGEGTENREQPVRAATKP